MSKIAVFRNIFSIVVCVVIQQEPSYIATYKDIQAWIKQKYGMHVSNLSISQVKEICGLAKNEYKGYKGKEGHYVPVLRADKEKAIKEAFKHFGMI